MLGSEPDPRLNFLQGWSGSGDVCRTGTCSFHPTTTGCSMIVLQGMTTHFEISYSRLRICDVHPGRRRDASVLSELMRQPGNYVAARGESPCMSYHSALVDVPSHFTYVRPITKNLFFTQSCGPREAQVCSGERAKVNWCKQIYYVYITRSIVFLLLGSICRIAAPPPSPQNLIFSKTGSSSLLCWPISI